MDKELVRHGQSEHREAAGGTSPQPSTPDCSTPSTLTPPRLTPNPMLLDSPAATLTPTTSSPPPPLTPAPCVSTTNSPKMPGTTAASPHMLISSPPKLTSTAAPALRTYSRTLLPSPTGVPKAPPTTQSPTLLPLPSSSASSSSLSVASTTSLTNGRPGLMSSSSPITPFHTPASPPGRQAHPVGTSGPVAANHSLSPVRHKLSQQTLLLGKGLRGSGPDQVLLRAQMLILTSAMRPALCSSSSSSTSSSPPSSNPASAQLQNLTLRPPAPGTLAIPPSLRLKNSSLAPPPLSPHTHFFPPLRPRPPPSTTATESLAMPSRHLSVPPPTLYSPVRAVPLRPRLHSPNGHRLTSPRPTSTFQPVAASLAGKPSAGPKSCPSSQSVLRSSQSQRGSLPASSLPDFEHLPSAARQLQIIALSSGRQAQSAPGSHALQPPSHVTESAEPPCQKKKTSGGEDGPHPPPDGPKPASSIPSPPFLPSPASPLNQTAPQTATTVHRCDVQEPQEKLSGARATTGDQGSVRTDQEVEKDDGGEQEKEEGVAGVTEGKDEEVSEEEQMKVTEEGESIRERSRVQPGVEEEETAMEQSGGLTAPKSQNSASDGQEAKATTGLLPAPEVSLHTLTPRSQQEPSLSQEDGEQSDNQSALSSLSSQSPPTSPSLTPPAENTPALLPPRPADPTDLSEDAQKVAKAPLGDLQRSPEPAESLSQSENESEILGKSLSGAWEPKAWPEGRQVLTHLVDGFVIQEGLQPFPVNRSSLLVPGQVTKPQEVNGTNGSAAATPVTDATKQMDPSSDSEQDEAGDTDESMSRSLHRDRTVLHCQFCGKRGHAHNFMRSKRFCSTSCARGFNIRLTKRLRALSAGGRSDRPRPALNRAESVPGKPLLLRLPRDLWSAGRREKEGKDKMAAVEEEEEEEEDMEEGEEEEEEDDDNDREEDGTVAMTARMDHQPTERVRRASAPAMTAATPTTTFRPAPSQWSVEEVTAFITTLPGCSDVAEAFRLQEIDGQALLLLTEDHLMTSMNIKLGPALKICAHINALKNQ